MALLAAGLRPRLLTRSLLALGCIAGLARSGSAQDARGTLEEQVKAAYLYNFTRYVEWPARAFAGPQDPIVICLLSSARFAEIVGATVRGRRSQNRPVRVVRLRGSTPLRGCHLAFLEAEARGADDWLRALRDSAVLSVGEGDGFLAGGGVVAFVIEDETVRFEVDAAAARRAGLEISSRVLALATRVLGEGVP
jgi:hypothetical protein